MTFKTYDSSGFVRPTDIKIWARTPGTIGIEAEAATLEAPWTGGEATGASGDRYVSVPESHVADDNQPTGSPPPSGTLSYEFDLASSGEYTLWCRARGPDGGANSVWLRVDDGSWMAWHLAEGQGWFWNVWTTDSSSYRLNDRTQETVTLGAGTHRVDVRWREDGTQLDRFLVTDDLGLTPSGEAGAAATGWQSARSVRTYDGSQWTTVYPSTSGTTDAVTAGPWEGGNPGPSSLRTPQGSEWSELGTVLTPSSSGWDQSFDQVKPSAFFRDADGRYWLYYSAADGSRSTDGGPRRRRIGAATTTTIDDPSSWTKHPSNPLIEFLPNEGTSLDEEEGIDGVTGFVDVDGTLYLYATCATALDETSVETNVRLYSSTDFVNFTDRGRLLSWDDSRFSTEDDELFVGAAYGYKGSYYLYFNDQRNAWVAYGSDPTTVDNNVADVGWSSDLRKASSVVPLGTDDTDVSTITSTYGSTQNVVWTKPATQPTGWGQVSSETFADGAFHSLFRTTDHWYYAWNDFSRSEYGGDIRMRRAPVTTL